MSYRTCAILAAAFSLVASHAVGDCLLYQYEGDVVPYEESAGWVTANQCEDPCVESVESGHFVLQWPWAGDLVNYHYWIAQPPDLAPGSLWVEWRFRSNHPKSPYFYTCDAWFALHYAGIREEVYMYGDAAISSSGDFGVLGLDIDRFHTYRFESLDGVNYWVSVDGGVFLQALFDNPNGYHFLQFGGSGGCGSDQIPNMINEWDFVRFGTISYGEQIVASDPAASFLDAGVHAGLDRFTITFDEPNYVYLDEITVEVTGGVAPEAIQTRRRENDGPDTVEIVLHRPIPLGQTTRFTFNDGVAINVVEYTFAPGDTDGDGDADLHDFAVFQTCFGQTAATGPCSALDLQTDDTIDLADYALFKDLIERP